jgi:hypothetical protein
LQLVIVASPNDSLARAVSASTASRGLPSAWYAPYELAALHVELRDEQFLVDSIPVSSVLWRVSPYTDLSWGFTQHDQSFADAEVAATWLAALQLPGITAINRFDAAAWYSGLRWDHWCARLRRAGIQIAPLCIGEKSLPVGWRWVPYGSEGDCEVPDMKARAAMAAACRPGDAVFSAVCVCGHTLNNDVPRTIARTAELLHQWGIAVARVFYDSPGRICSLSVLPMFDPQLLTTVADRLGSCFYDHCAAWRS